MNNRLLIAAVLCAAPLVASADDASHARDLAASCAMCHGTNGRSAGGNEPLAGAAKADLVRKLAEFRSGARPATVMHQIAKGYSEREIELIAGFFSTQRK